MPWRNEEKKQWNYPIQKTQFKCIPLIFHCWVGAIDANLKCLWSLSAAFIRSNNNLTHFYFIFMYNCKILKLWKPTGKFVSCDCCVHLANISLLSQIVCKFAWILCFFRFFRVHAKLWINEDGRKKLQNFDRITIVIFVYGTEMANGKRIEMQKRRDPETKTKENQLNGKYQAINK